MSETAELAEKLKSEGERMTVFFSALSGEQWGAEVYTEGAAWTIRNVLAHYVTSERGLVKLFEQIRQGGGGSPDDFSIDRYNASQQEKTKEHSPAELLEQYKSVRAESVAWVQGLKDEELEITGRHPFLGQTSLREMIKMLYLHNQLHLRDVKRALN
ncbi:MAG: DinB family protein [Chloroflexota bacterium]